MSSLPKRCHHRYSSILQYSDFFCKDNTAHSSGPKGGEYMNKKIIFLALSVIVGSLIFAPLQNSEAALSASNTVSYTSSDGSVDKYMTKLVVQPYKKGSQYWSYIVKVCATDYPLAVATVELKSDMEKVLLGVNSVIAKGKCSFYGAVMKANDGKTLGATMLLKGDAVNEIQNILTKLPTSTKAQKDQYIGRLVQLYNTLGYVPRF